MSADNQFQQWMLDTYDKSDMQDIAHYGCVMGVAGMIYYSETTELYRRFKDDIWSILDELADDYGTSVPELIAQGNGADKSGSVTQFENYLVWMAAETVANRIVETNAFSSADDDDDE